MDDNIEPELILTCGDWDIVVESRESGCAHVVAERRAHSYGSVATGGIEDTRPLETKERLFWSGRNWTDRSSHAWQYACKDLAVKRIREKEMENHLPR